MVDLRNQKRGFGFFDSDFSLLIFYEKYDIIYIEK